MSENHASLQPTGDSLPALAGESAVETKRDTAKRRADATREIAAMAAELAAQEAEFKAQREALELELRRRKDALAERMAPLRQEIERLEEVAWTVDLYLGRDEEIELLADGKPAPADTPITIRQMVLAMDEECLVNVENGGVDIRSVADFLAWLVADPANRDRIIPDQRGVVVLVPSRRQRDYGDAWFTAKMAEANRTPHWIIRNGDRLYLLVTGAERGGDSLKVGENLLPTRNEFIDLFYERSWGGGERKPMQPGSDAWMKAEARSSALQRHYMRIMLVLQGIVDRSVAFHPLPDGGVNLMSVRAQDEGKVRIIDETSLVLTDGRESFTQYQSRLNALLRPGMRVIGNFTSAEWRSLHHRSQGGYDRDYHKRVHPRTAGYPHSDVPYVVTRRAPGGGFVITYPRGRVYVDRYEPDPDKPGWMRWVGERDAKSRASATLYASDGFILPFDLVGTEELTRFLYSRADRKDYLHMVPVLRAALAAKAQEAAVEAPFRTLLAATLAADHGLDLAQVEPELESLIRWYKIGLKWFRPFQGEPEQEARAMETIRAEFTARRRVAADASKDAALVAVARKVPGAIAVLTVRSGKSYAYAPAAEGETVYLTRTEVTPRGPGKVEAWVQAPARTLSTARTLWATDTWRDWDHAAIRADHLTGPERAAVIEQVLAKLPGTPIVVTEQLRSDWGPHAARRFEGFAWKPDVDLSDFETPARPRHRHGVDTRLAGVRMYWKRTARGAVEIAQTDLDHEPRWGAHHEKDGDRPWLQPGDTYYERNTSAAHLVWSDPAQVALLNEWRKAYDAHLSAGRADVSLGWEEAVTFREAAQVAWLTREAARERVRFDEDFGGADDLWEHHLATLRLERKYKQPRWLDDLSRRICRAGIVWDGKTLTELAALDPTTEPVEDLGDFADLRLVKP